MIGFHHYHKTKLEQSKNRDSCVIGHDVICKCDVRRQLAEYGHKKRRKVAIKARSTNDLPTSSPQLAPPRSCSSDQVKTCLSASTLTDNGTTRTVVLNDKTPFFGRIESLAKLFSCASFTDDSKTDLSRHNGTYSYTALESDTNVVQERLEFELKARERAQNICVQHLKSTQRFSLIHQLNEIGSRIDKHWFLIKDTSVKTERLLTLVPKGPNCPVQCTPEIRKIILDMFVALQHPYIYPVLDINFKTICDTDFVIVTLPFNERGSLKDFIYKTQWQDEWGHKYSQRSSGLAISQIQRLGRQILEALLFLRDKGFPPCSHIHTGNIILQNGVARITGLENTLLGYTSRIHNIIWSRAQSEPNLIDALCFGHILFEMCSGFELDQAKPTHSQLLDLHNYQQVVEILEFIFESKHLPTIEDLLLCDLFRNIDLREMRNLAQSTQVFKTELTPSAVEMLKEIKKFQNGRRKKQRTVTRVTSLSSPENGSSNSSSKDQSHRTSASDMEGDLEEDSFGPEMFKTSISHEEHRMLRLHTRSSTRIPTIR